MTLNRAGQMLPDAAGTGASSHVPGALNADRADQAALVKDARDRLRGGSQVRLRVATQPGDAEAKARASKNWHLWAVFDILLLLLIVPLVVAVPLLLDCRKKDGVSGFFAGASFGKCARAGIEERWAILDARLKLVVRNSGH